MVSRAGSVSGGGFGAGAGGGAGRAMTGGGSGSGGGGLAQLAAMRLRMMTRAPNAAEAAGRGSVAVIAKLQLDAEVLTAQHGHDRLQFIA